MHALLAADRRTALITLQRLLDSAGYHDLCDDLTRLGPRALVATELWPLARKLRRAARRALRRPTTRRLPRLRIRPKMLRYALDAVDQPTHRRLRRRLKRLEELLGKHHDSTNQVVWMHAGTGQLPTTSTEAAGALAVLFARRARRLARRIRAAALPLTRSGGWRCVRS